jgi:hypothetical protein
VAVGDYVVTLTDEEIVALEGVESVAPRFWYDALPPALRETAVAVAARSLVARGWAVADPAAVEVSDLALEALEPLRSALALRRTASVIVVAEQKLESETRARVCYLQPDGGALEEAVNSGGLHRFTTMPAFAAISELAAWCDPFETPGPPRPREQAVGEREIADAVSALDEPRVVTVVAVVSARGERQVEGYLSVYAGADRLVVGSPEGSGVLLSDVGRPELTERLAAMVE